MPISEAIKIYCQLNFSVWPHDNDSLSFMTVIKSDALFQSLERSEQTDIDLEKQNVSTQDIEHVTVKDDPRMWSSKRKVCAFWLWEQLNQNSDELSH